uniref:Uncharacterized protein n=1 Tax=Anguilla anguilla TaxID=7936 RepID=A0A0E9WPW9_ANGAN
MFSKQEKSVMNHSDIRQKKTFFCKKLALHRSKEQSCLDYRANTFPVLYGLDSWKKAY